nr:hypothetical protein [Bradyrhizobium oropedii]
MATAFAAEGMKAMLRRHRDRRARRGRRCAARNRRRRSGRGLRCRRPRQCRWRGASFPDHRRDRTPPGDGSRSRRGCGAGAGRDPRRPVLHFHPSRQAGRGRRALFGDFGRDGYRFGPKTGPDGAIPVRKTTLDMRPPGRTMARP